MSIFKNYLSPTPVKWCAWGDALLSVSAFATTYNIVNEDHRLAMIFLAVGVVGKLMTNLAAIEK